MKKQIEFDFGKWGQDGISVKWFGRQIITLHKDSNKPNYYYGLNSDSYAYSYHTSDLTMYQEVKPREIWVNEYTTGLAVMHYTEKAAIQQRDNARTFVKLIKFREVLDDEQ